MALPSVVKTWTWSVNNRITYVSLNSVASQVLYGIKNFLVATMGYTVKYTCDGTTGPTSGSDHTDRWSSASNCTTRGAGTGNAQSFCVLTDGNSVDILLAYQGSTDDVFRLCFSDGGLYTPAGTSNQQPTATDESVVMTGITAVDSGTSSDRVWHIMATSDKKLFRFFIYRQSTMSRAFGIETCTSAITAFTWTSAVVGWNSTATAANGQGGGHGTSGVNGATNSGIARVSATNIAVGGGGEMYINAFSFTSSTPELQAAAPIVPLMYASNTTNFGGKVGSRIDIWYPFVASIAQGDTFGSLQFVYFGTFMLPWDGSSSPSIT